MYKLYLTEHVNIVITSVMGILVSQWLCKMDKSVQDNMLSALQKHR